MASSSSKHRGCLNKTNSFCYVCGEFTAKLKEGIFAGPQIREIQRNIVFDELLTPKELRAWEAFKSVCNGFLGNTRVANYKA